MRVGDGRRRASDRDAASYAGGWEAEAANTDTPRSNQAYPRCLGKRCVQSPKIGRGLCVRAGREVALPTGFDNFTPAAMLDYRGPNPVIRSNLKLLQKAMARAGFYGLRTEWWHFCAGDWATYSPVPEIQLVAPAPRPGL